MKRNGLLVGVMALAFMFGNVSAQAAHRKPLANAVVLIIRHAEKPDDGPELAPAGVRRAAAYVHYFETYHVDYSVRRPDELIATADSHNSERPRLTLTPLSQATGLPLDTRFKDKDVDGLVSSLESTPGGNTILICWHHGEIPDLLQSLGVDPNSVLPGGKWPGQVYNWVIQLRYDADGHLIKNSVRRINERLMPGDAASNG